MKRTVKLFILALVIGLILGLFGLSIQAAPTRIPVSQGVSVTIIEYTNKALTHSFPVSQLMTTGATFTTGAHEKYTVKSDGIFLTIECVRPSYPDGPPSSGHNIDSVKLDLPDGQSFFAGEIISVTFGEDAVRGSEKNILGPTDGEITVLGDIFSSITVGFIKEVPLKPPIDTEKIKKKIEDAISEKEKIRDNKLPAIQELKDGIEGSKATLEDEVEGLKATGGVIEKRAERILRRLAEINQSLENISAELDEVEAQLDDLNSLLEEALDKLAEDKFTEVEEILAEAVKLLKNLIAAKSEALGERWNISKRFFQIKKELRALQKVNALSRNKWPVDEVKQAFVDFERKANEFISLVLDVYDELREIKDKLTGARELQAKIMSIPSAMDAEIEAIPAPFSVAEVRLYPNPVMHLKASYLKVTGKGIAGLKLEVFNLAGRKILEKEAIGYSLEFQAINEGEGAGELPANGVYLYIVTVYGANGGIVRSEVRKLVILR